MKLIGLSEVKLEKKVKTLIINKQNLTRQVIIFAAIQRKLTFHMTAFLTLCTLRVTSI